MSDSPPDTANVIAPPPLIFAGALLVGIVLQRVFPITVLPRRTARVVGACLIALSFAVGLPAVRAMRRAQTNLNPAQPTTAIVSTGPYRYTRNPIYLAFAVLYTGIALVANAFWALLLLPGVLLLMTRGVIMREERYLTRTFGAVYTDYAAQVRRWL